MKYFIVAGERSGDLHAGNLAASLKEQNSDVKLFGWGGAKMRKAGVQVLQDYESLAFMGFVEVLKNLPKILGFMRLVKRQIEEIKPDALILVDYAGFNLRLAKWAKSKGFTVFYYIPPKAWAWNEKRVHKLRKYTDLTLAIFPFEVDFFKSHGVNVKYVGNPLFDEIKQFAADINFRKNFDQRPIVALLPGSRKQEIENMLKTMNELCLSMPEYQWVVAGISSFTADFYKSYGRNFTLVFDKTYDLLSVASVAVVTSGTATLETALFHVPQVVVYKTSPITYIIAKLFVKIKYISLVNLIAEKGVVKELIQGEYNTENTKSELEKLFVDTKYRKKQLVEYNNIIKRLGETEASNEAAISILNFRKS